MTFRPAILPALLAAVLALPALAADPMQYGRAYLAEGEPVAAAQSYSQALKVNPFDAVALNNLAVAKAAAGDYQSARDLLARAQRIAPTRADIRANLNSLEQWMDSYGGAPPVRRAPPPRSAAILPEPPPPWPLAGQASTCKTEPCR